MLQIKLFVPLTNVKKVKLNANKCKETENAQ